MSWIAVAIGGSALLSSVIGANASQSAADTQAGAANNATAQQKAMWDQVMGNLQPYMAQGTQSLGQLGGYMNADQHGGPGGAPGLLHQFGAQDLNANLAPNYQFQLGQGMGMMQNQSAAAGGAGGGNAFAGEQAFAQNTAAGAYQNAFNNYNQNQQNIYSRLGNLAQLGQASSTGQASGAAQFAGGISNSIIGAGNAQAAGTIGSANAIASGVGGLASSYLMGNMMNQGNLQGYGYGANYNAQNYSGQMMGPPDLTQSDRRLKKHIKQIGEAKGLKLYEFRYIWESDTIPVHTGHMSDEVREVKPEAVTVDENGFDMVNYGML